MARRILQADILRVSERDREWLSVAEAARFAGVDPSNIDRWRRAGLMRKTCYLGRNRPLINRGDLQRTISGQRWRNGGINTAQAREKVETGQR